MWSAIAVRSHQGKQSPPKHIFILHTTYVALTIGESNPLLISSNPHHQCHTTTSAHQNSNSLWKFPLPFWVPIGEVHPSSTAILSHIRHTIALEHQNPLNHPPLAVGPSWSPLYLVTRKVDPSPSQSPTVPHKYHIKPLYATYGYHGHVSVWWRPRNYHQTGRHHQPFQNCRVSLPYNETH